MSRHVTNQLIRVVRDHYDDQWSVYEERHTEHGWPLLLGRPHTGESLNRVGGNRVILMTDLVEYLIGIRYERGAVNLPVGGTALWRIRRLLGINIYDDMREWWEEHADELSSMTEAVFAEKYGFSPAKVSMANKVLFGKRINDAGWWLKEPARSLIKGDSPRAQVAEELEISIGAVGRLRWRLRCMNPETGE